MEKIIAFLLSLSMIFTSSGLSVSTLNSLDGTDIPVVHVVGTGDPIVRYNDGGEKEYLYPPQLEENFIEEKANEILPVFADAFFTQEWDEFCDVLVDILVPIFSPMALDKNGEASDGSFVNWSWSRESLPKSKNSQGRYPVNQYEFHYDWRLDNMVTAQTLHKYIEDVLYVTGAEKVALYGRCLGSNIVATYMYMYEGEYVSEVIHYASAVYGATQCSKAFTGELCLHKDGISRFAFDIENLGVAIDDVFLELICALVVLLNDTYGLDITVWAVNNVLKDIYLDIFPEVMRSSYGTFPSYWSMVRIDDYQRALDTVFYGVDKAEYSKLIEKVEFNRNNVQLMFGERSMVQASKGIEFSNIVKYGMQSIPVTDNSDDLSDGLVTVNESSFGALATKVNETFTEEYINRSVIDGTSRYISPDKQIDASYCLAPDSTWFVKNLFHTDFPRCINGLVSDIVNYKDFTVESNPEYPQYLVYDKEKDVILPMSEDNMNTTDRWYSMSFIDALKILINYFKTIINNLTSR